MTLPESLAATTVAVLGGTGPQGRGLARRFADAGLPLPEEVTVVDLSITFGLPTMEAVLRAVMAELVVEGATIATESSQEFISVVQETGKLADAAISTITHEELKAQLHNVKLIIRTGDTTPFANVIFRCGVPF